MTSRNVGRNTGSAPVLRSMLTSNSKEKPNGVFWLVGLIICVQFGYQLLINRMVNQEEETWDSCESADTGSISPQCQENRLFHSWQGENGVVADNEDHMQDLLSVTEDEKLDAPLIASSPQSAKSDETIKINESMLTPWAKKFAAFQKGAVLKARQFSDSKTNGTELTPWAKSLVAIQKSFELRGEEINARKSMTPWAKHLEEIMAQFEAKKKQLDAQKHKRNHNVSARTEKTLEERIKELGRQMCLEPHRIHRPVCKQFLTGEDLLLAKKRATTHLRGTKPPAIQEATNAVDAALHSNPRNSMTPWAKDLVDLQEHLEFQMRLRQARSANKTEMAIAEAKIFEARLKELAERKKSLEKALLSQIKSLQDLAEGSRSWEKATEKQIHTFGQKLCADPARRDYAACAQFRDAADKVMHGGNSNLNWPAVTAWKTLPHEGEAMITHQDQLMQEHWNGSPPKVACITVIPSHGDVEAWLGVFIDNFRAQKYEGATQLVLVYHHLDTVAAKLVKAYADGIYIMGAATRDTDFPSAISFRYGAWLSDADVVARWDFDAWHHTDRLAMQVRALALTKRPVSVLAGWTVRELDSHTYSEPIDEMKSESTIIGETKWMQEQWFPKIKTSVNWASQLVKVDMPGLMTYDKALQDVVLAKSD